MRHALVGEFESADRCAEAIRRLRERGYRRLDAYMPFPAKSVSEALETKKSPLPWLTFACGLAGAALAYFIMWWTQAADYPLNVGGRPAHAVPAFVPITFETAVLFAGVSAFVGGLLLCGLPRLHHPIFELDGIERVSIGSFMLVVESEAPEAEELLVKLGAVNVQEVEL